MRKRPKSQAGGAIRKNLTAGLTRSTTSSSKTAAREHKSELRILEILTMCQIVALFLIVIVSLQNLSLTDRDMVL